MRRGSGAGALLWLGAALAATPAQGAGEVAPGSYCPLPQPGEEPGCLTPARAEYGEFFRGLEGGLSDADAERVEGAVARGGAPGAYLALSSLAYGYYQLSRRAATQGDPEIAARLERWNALLGAAYDANQTDASYRAALREAARDLRRRAPPVTLRCLDDEGVASPCDSTAAILRGIDRSSDEVGLGAGLRRVLRRLWGGSEEP